jgi:hypothetical protein
MVGSILVGHSAVGVSRHPLSRGLAGTDSWLKVTIEQSFTLTDTRHEIVSLLMLTTREDDWHIQRECVQSIRRESLGGCGGGGGGAICSGGQCPLH